MSGSVTKLTKALAVKAGQTKGILTGAAVQVLFEHILLLGGALTGVCPELSLGLCPCQHKAKSSGGPSSEARAGFHHKHGSIAKSLSTCTCLLCLIFCWEGF